jgi:hypothetical protein
VFNGQIAHEIRVIDKQTGQQVYGLNGTYWSDYTANYTARDAGKVVLFHTGSAPHPWGGFYFTNLKSYWSNGGEWVANP